MIPRPAPDVSPRRDTATPVYLDFHATTPLDPRVLDAMLPWLCDRVGNPHSQTHSAGQRARKAVETARGQIAELIGAMPDEIIFTSGATEATNIVLRGAIERKKGAIVTSAIEHSCVRETVADLAKRRLPIAYAPVAVDGVVDADAVAEMVNERPTRIVSLMMVNNETGVIQPVSEISAHCRAAGALLHSDAAQALGKISIDVRALGVDFLSLSAHKVYGPGGIGAFFCRKSSRGELRPILTGGGQEKGLRPGTLPTALCVGFGTACAILQDEAKVEQQRIGALRDDLLARLRAGIPGIHVNGSESARVAGNLNVAFEGIDADALLARLPDVAASPGSACSSAALEPSHVLTAMGFPRDHVLSSVRICIGRQTTASEVAFAATRFAEEVEALRIAMRSGTRPAMARSAR